MDLQLQFQVSILPSPPHCHMHGLADIFRQKVDTTRLDNGLNPLSTREKEKIMQGAVFTYHLKNSFDEDWKKWDEPANADHASPTPPRSRSHLPRLPFGSYNDPLRSMALAAVFPLGRDTTLIDDAVHSNMDALTASFWELTREFAPAPQQRAFLSSLVDQAVYAWVRDPGNADYLAPFDSDNRADEWAVTTHRPRSSPQQTDAYHDDPGLMRQLLYHAMGQPRRPPPGPPANPASIFKPEQIDHALHVLFHNDTDDLPTNGTHPTNHDDLLLYTTSALGMRFKHGNTVPPLSFLWNMLVLCLDLISQANQASRLSTPASLVSLLRLVWTDVMRRVRWHWEHLIPLPNIASNLYDQQQSTPTSSNGNILGIDLRFSLLHQKLNMINCCILQRRQNMNDLPPSPKYPTLSSKQAKRASAFDKLNGFLEQLIEGDDQPEIEQIQKPSSDDPSDMSDGDYFFDSVDDMEKTTVLAQGIHPSAPSQQPDTGKDPTRSCSSSMTEASDMAHAMQESFVRLSPSAEFEPLPPVDDQDEDDEDGDGFLEWTETDKGAALIDPNAFEGRLEEHPSLALLDKSPMWVPMTQNPGFMTEDMIQQQADVFEKMGNSLSATQLRARLQSAHLYSDMQAFKAANPTGVLEDFVRWHSPKDWVVDDDQDDAQGYLSARMADPHNIWQDLWKWAKRVPAAKQRSLFDLNAEGEKALHYLESLTANELFGMLLPTLGLIVYDTLLSHPVVKYVRSVVVGVQQLGQELCNYPWDALRNGQCVFDAIIAKIKKEELLLCNAISLLRKLPGQNDLVDRLLKESQVRVQEGDERATVFQLFKNDYDVISSPSCKEYVFYLDAGVDCPLPQRFYALLKDNEARFTEMNSLDGRFC
ncbi:hypothetical protein DM01DRAFT_1333029 [Hesseltinella vesiculosa]|uniref:Rab3 GTPase-activating protein catalytic subunit n=1 Tax=Hesseltinella vesiculosa TaxID=101127 RepID=A0A1X2GR62_9FUNG|nr:hypothetical protein DM01DRAFT_1333029 [Hesseltinella vesiculosa]